MGQIQLEVHKDESQILTHQVNKAFKDMTRRHNDQ
jgi:hypothetical protein